MDGTNERRGWRDWSGKAALALGGLLVGGVLVGTLTASADDTNAGSQNSAYGVTPNGAYGGPGGPRHGDASRSQRPDERLLSGDTASEVRAAALAKYPGATILRVETDSDGVYEAHLTTSDGRRVTVEVDKSLKVTGEESGPGRP